VVKVYSLTRDRFKNPLVALALYSGIPHEEQVKIHEKALPDCRKVVFATDLAETGVTIDGVVFVIDSGLTKASALCHGGANKERFDPLILTRTPTHFVPFWHLKMWPCSVLVGQAVCAQAFVIACTLKRRLKR
jgi:hypothetical protein